MRRWVTLVLLLCASNAGHSQPAKSTVGGVYTPEQAKRGEKVHSIDCARCHGPLLDGAGQPEMPSSPAIAGSMLFFKWKGQTVAALFEYVRTKMPLENPGTLSAQDSIDAIAHMFALSEMPPGDKELPPDASALVDIVIADKPK